MSDATQPDGPVALDRKLVALCRERGPLRAILLHVAEAVDPLGRFVDGWIAWAGQVTVRRLREDVDWALALAETDRVAFRQSGGLPSAPGEGRDREIRAPHREPARESSAAVETCSVRFFGPAEVVQLFHAVLCTVRRRMERDVGRAARLRCAGRAPDGLTWQMGLRRGAPPLVTYRSGDVEVVAR